MSSRKETIRDGLEIDCDLLDSDLLRCFIQQSIVWNDGPVPLLVWMDYTDGDGWTEESEPKATVMTRTLDDERELAEGDRMIRLWRYTSYGCLAELRRRPPEEGEFVIRRPPMVGRTSYVCKLDPAATPHPFGDPDTPEFAAEPCSFWVTPALEEAQRFSHEEAVRMTVRIMEELGEEIAGENGDYYEPVRIEIAAELHARAARRPRHRADLHAIINDLSREP